VRRTASAPPSSPGEGLSSNGPSQAAAASTTHPRTALTEQIERYLRYLQDERRASPLTVSTYGRDLYALERWLHDRPAHGHEARAKPARASKRTAAHSKKLAVKSKPARRTRSASPDPELFRQAAEDHALHEHPVSATVVLGDIAAEKLEARDLRSFLAANAREREPATLIRKVSALRAFYRFLMRRAGLTHNPASELSSPKLRRKLPTFLSVEKAGETVEMPTDTGTAATALRDRALLEVLYGSGVRVSELVGLDLTSLDLESGTAKVLGKGNKERIVPLGSAARTALREYLALRGDLRSVRGTQDPRALYLSVRGERLGVRQVQLLTKRYGTLATGNSALHPHALRHSCATHLLDAGADLRSIQELLGHVSLSTTQRYTHVSMDQLQAVYSKAHPLSVRRSSTSTSTRRKDHEDE